MEQAQIPVFKPWLGQDTRQAVADAFDVGWIGMGASTLAFERALQAFLQTDRHVTAVMTGTAALHLGLLLADVGSGDEVILPSFNYIADVQAIVMAGATPVFADIDPRTLSLDPARVAALITPRTRAIMPLHFAGVVGDLDAIYSLAKTHNLRVVEDATHAIGSTHHGRPIGSFGDITCFSFDPVKLITCLDGGAIVCSREEDIAALHRLRLLGVDKDTTERYKNRRAWDYDVTGLGFRAHMTNINAAVGLSQLRRISEFLTSRRRDCETYTAAFRELEEIQTLSADYSAVGPFIFTVQVLEHRRENFIASLAARGVATGIHFLPCHEKSFCRGFPRGPMPVTEQVGRRIVTLPLWSDMPESIRSHVINAVGAACMAPEAIAA
jgi:dTDP-4-amino-4,6-dideoxygalactose transaminase